MAIDALVFDLDGTLVDSAADIAEAVNRLFDALALPRVDAALVRGWIGDGVSALVATALAHQRSAVALEQALPVFMAGYHDCLLRSPRLYPGWPRPWPACSKPACRWPSAPTSRWSWCRRCWPTWA